MKRILFCIFFLFLAACGKKEWPQPIASEELIYIDHLEARLDQNCMQLSAKLGGNLLNLEFFLVEIEQDGCPTCPFTPTIVHKVYPYGEGVERRENSYVITLCQPLTSKNLRVRVKADNTHSIIDPGVSEIITLGPPLQ